MLLLLQLVSLRVIASERSQLVGQRRFELLSATAKWASFASMRRSRRHRGCHSADGVPAQANGVPSSDWSPSVRLGGRGSQTTRSAGARSCCSTLTTRQCRVSRCELSLEAVWQSLNS